MGRQCSICTHERRGEIEALLIEGVSYRAISGQFGVSKSAVERHAADHLPEGLLQAHGAEELARADDLLDQVRDLQARTLSILVDTETSKDHPTALRAIGEARRNLELLAKLTERLGDGSTTVNIQIDARTQSVILEALTPYPEARVAVSEALRQVEE